jgi:putative membrane protein
MSLISFHLIDQRGNWDHMHNWGSWWWMWLIALMTMTALVLVVVWAVRSATGSSGAVPPDPLDRAREILAERYARGELTTEEYRERLDQLH